MTAAGAVEDGRKDGAMAVRTMQDAHYVGQIGYGHATSSLVYNGEYFNWGGVQEYAKIHRILIVYCSSDLDVIVPDLLATTPCCDEKG
jgi:hypothetical protein